MPDSIMESCLDDVLFFEIVDEMALDAKFNDDFDGFGFFLDED